jgi:hypothetical protein
LATVFADGYSGSRFVWVADFTPDELADRIGQMMGRGIAVVKETLERKEVRAPPEAASRYAARPGDQTRRALSSLGTRDHHIC